MYLLIVCTIVALLCAESQGTGLYFTTNYPAALGWCDLDKYTIPTCTPSTAVYLSGWGSQQAFAGAIVADSNNNVYVINETYVFPQQPVYNVWSVQGFDREIVVKSVANVSSPFAFHPPSRAVWMSNHIAKGHDAVALFIFSTANNLNQTILVVDAQTWKVVQTFDAPDVPWSIYGGGVYYNNTLIFGSAIGNLTNFNGVLQQTFVCTPEMEQICAPRSFVSDLSTLTGYFATGWQVWKFPLADPTSVSQLIDISRLGNVNGVFGGAWFYDNTYWYGDATRNVDYIQLSSPPRAFPTKNSLGNSSTITQAHKLSSTLLDKQDGGG